MQLGSKISPDIQSKGDYHKMYRYEENADQDIEKENRSFLSYKRQAVLEENKIGCNNINSPPGFIQ